MVWMGRQIIFIYFLLGRARYQKWQERILKDQIAMGSILFWARSSGRPHPQWHCPFFLRLQEKNWSCHLLSAASHLQWELPQHCWWILTLKLIQADLPTSSQSLVTLRLIIRLSTCHLGKRIHLCIRPVLFKKNQHFTFPRDLCYPGWLVILIYKSLAPIPREALNHSRRPLLPRD